MTGRTIRRAALGILIAAAYLAAPAAPAVAAEESAAGRNTPGRHDLGGGVTFAGSLRVRGEDRKGFRFLPERPADEEDFVLTQVRLNVQWKPVARLTGFAELQDARIFGERGIDEDAVPNVFADNLDLHQAYLDARLGPDDGNSPVLRVGRQKLNLGDLRLVASLEWVNTARVVDGLRLTLRPGEGRTLDLFASRLVPVDPRHANDHGPTASRLFNSAFHGAFLTDTRLIPDASLELFALHRRQSDAGDRVSTAGGRVAWRRGAWLADGSAAWQFGQYGGQDHRAWMLHAGGSWTAPAPVRSTFGLAYDHGSGDDDPDDGRHETFDNLYPLNHAYYGYMDFISLQNVHAFEAFWKRSFGGKVTARVAWHEFRLDEERTDAWYDAGARPLRTAGRDVRADVGSELDVTLQARTLRGRLALLLGASRFFPGGYVEDTGSPGARDANFTYLQAKLVF